LHPDAEILSKILSPIGNVFDRRLPVQIGVKHFFSA
jgi:hypothetical protein